jgi:hypothetical protein
MAMTAWHSAYHLFTQFNTVFPYDLRCFFGIHIFNILKEIIKPRARDTEHL